MAWITVLLDDYQFRPQFRAFTTVSRKHAYLHSSFPSLYSLLSRVSITHCRGGGGGGGRCRNRHTFPEDLDKVQPIADVIIMNYSDIGGSHSKVVARWAAGQQLEKSVLHL